MMPQQDTKSQAIAQDTLDRLAAVASTRGSWEAVWEQIAARIFPHYSQQFFNQGSVAGLSPFTGVQRTEEMVDATGALALTRFAAAMESKLTPRSGTWHYLKIGRAHV